MRPILWLSVSISIALGVISAGLAIGPTIAPPPQPAQQPPAAAEQNPTSAPSTALNSKVWIGHSAEYEEFLRTAVIDRTLEMGSATRVFFKPGGLAASAALKSHGTKSEIAGYRLDRVLGLDMVPPTVEARYNGEMTGL